MKPNKNRIYCLGCRKHKMLFEEKKNADNFIRFNQEIILEESGKAPVRSYYCVFCSGWHVTSNPSLEHGEEQDKRDMDLIENTISVKHDISSFNMAINQKIIEIKRAIYLSIDSFDFYKEYEYCRLLLPEFLRINPCASKSKLLQQIYMVSDVLSTFTEIKLMDISELKRFLVTLNSDSEKVTLIKRYAISKLIDLSLDECSDLYKRGETHQALKIKEELFIMLNDINGVGMKKFNQKYKSKINDTFNRLSYLTHNMSCSEEENYKKELLFLINNLVIINDKFDNLEFSKCRDMVYSGISKLSTLPKDKNVELVLSHYQKWANTLERI